MQDSSVVLPLLAIVGPTAIGKSNLAIHIAQVLGGEIVSVDSRQIYKHMDIGTAKPSADERARIPHHLIDIRTPDQNFSLASFLSEANEAIRNAQDRNHLPIVVGGTGQYMWALLEGWQVPHVAPNPNLRRYLEFQLHQQGPAELHRQLSSVNPAKGSEIGANNGRRIIRALEIHYSGNRHFAQKPSKYPRPESSLIIGLTTERDTLYRQIDTRVDTMIELGLVEEVMLLQKLGYSSTLHSMSSVGYQEIYAQLAGEASLEETIQRIKYRSHHVARHQYSWFRPKDSRIHWIEADGDQLNTGLRLAQDFMASMLK